MHVHQEVSDGAGEDTALLANVARRDQLLAENQWLRNRIVALQGPPTQPSVKPLYRGSRVVALLVVAGLAAVGLCLIASAFSPNETEGTRLFAAVLGTLFIVGSLSVLLYEVRSSRWLSSVLQRNWTRQQAAVTELQQLRQQYLANQQRIAALNAEISAAAHEDGGRQ